MAADRPTHAAQRLARAGVAHTEHAYDAELRSGVGAAEALGVEPARVLKSLVVRLERAGAPPRTLVALCPSDRELDLRALARAAGGRRAALPPPEEAERLTGLRTGGISPLALAPGRFEVWLHRDALARSTVFVSAGRRGREVELAPRALREHLDAREFE